MIHFSPLVTQLFPAIVAVLFGGYMWVLVLLTKREARKSKSKP